jgi:dihydroflavonol-4-reductase
MKVFLTGGNGFIGSVVARQLVASGYDIVCLLRETSRLDRIAMLPFTRASGDVRDVASLREAMSKCDCTVHLAAPGAWEQDEPSLLSQVLEGGARNVLEVAAKLRDHRVVVVSSTAAIAASNRPVVFDERAAFSMPDMKLHYAFAKHRAEIIALEAYERGAPVIIVNPAEVYGPGDTALVTAGNLIDFATSTPVLVCKGGTCVVHVDDVAAGIVAAVERGRPGERYILGGENLTIRRLAELVLELIGRRARVVEIPNRLARFATRLAVALRLPLPYNPHVVPYATRYWFVDSAKAQRELGVAFRGARETIGATLDWLEETMRLPSRRIGVSNRLDFPK